MTEKDADRELVHEGEIARLFWIPKTKCIELEARGDASSAQYRATMERLLQLVQEKGATSLLADTADVAKISDEDLLWTEADWSPRLGKTGMRFVAIVMPRSLGLHLSLDKMTHNVDARPLGQLRRFFNDPEAGREWLRQQ